MYQLEGKTCVVTGLETPIGRAVAIALADAGCDVAMLCAIDTEPTEQVRALIAGEHRKVRIYETDVRDEAAARMALERAHDDFGVAQILVNAPSAMSTRDLSGGNGGADFEQALAGAPIVTRALLDRMVEAGWGRIINIAPPPPPPPPNGRKGATEAHAAASRRLAEWTRSLARDMAPKCVTVNCVAPGYVEWPDHDDPKRLDPEIQSRIPAGRAGQLDEIASAVVFLASPHSAYITGERIRVSGGMDV